MQADSIPAEPQGKPKYTGVGSLSLLQWIFPTQELNQGLLHCRWILYQLSYQALVQKQIYAISSDRLSFQSLLYGPLYKNLGHPKNTVLSKKVHGVHKIPVFRLLPILIKYNIFPWNFNFTHPIPVVNCQFFHTLIRICYCTNHGLSQKHIPGLWSHCLKPVATWDMPLLLFWIRTAVPQFLGS